MSKEAAIAFVQSNGFVASVAEKPAKVAKAKVAKSTKVNLEKAVRTINASFKAKTKEVPAAPVEQPSANSIAEIAKIKAKNLETMRRVSNKLAALRSY